MFRDKALTFFENAAFDAESQVIDFSIADSAVGEPVSVFFQGGADIVATSGLVIELQEAEDGAGPFAPRMTLSVSEREAKGLIKFAIPHPARRYAKLVLTGATAGTNINSGIILDTQLGF
jgi:hypothetical protein